MFRLMLAFTAHGLFMQIFAYIQWTGPSFNQVSLMSEVILTGIPRGPIGPGGPGSP